MPVICYGLRTDFRGAGFAGSLELLAIADARHGGAVYVKRTFDHLDPVAG